MNTTLTLILITVALIIGIVIGSKFGRIILLLALIGAVGWVLVSLPKILGLIEKVQAVGKILGW